MVAWILSGKFKVLKNAGTKNNHIGLPLTLLSLTDKHDIAVLELGTNHFGEIANLAGICQPTAGIITNIGPAHLEYFGDLKGVWREKYTLLSQLKSPSIAVLNADDRFLGRPPNVKKHPPFVLRFGLKKRCEFSAAHEKYASGRLEFRVNKKYEFTLETLGYYNIYNALAAIACGWIFGIGYKEMSRRLTNFEFPEGRLKARKFRLKNFIDDTYNSNPASLKQALEVLGNFETKGRKILVMGDMLELGKNSKAFHYQAGKQAAKVCDKFIAVGKLSRLAMDAASRSGLNKKDMFSCDRSWQAREILFKYIAPDKDDIILVKGSRAMNMEEIFRN
jgi:UDP-N-acetylmuramoyl-tripeptide--D-alanyl-D-alanine ligase